MSIGPGLVHEVIASLTASKLGLFSSSTKMQLFLRAQNTHTLEVTGEETVGQIKVRKCTLFACFFVFFICKIDLNCVKSIWFVRPEAVKCSLLVAPQAHVQALEGLQVEDQVLQLAGCPLEDEASLASCGVSEHCTLEVAGRLLGGKNLATVESFDS